MAGRGRSGREAAELKLLIHDAVSAANYVDADRRQWRGDLKRVARLDD